MRRRTITLVVVGLVMALFVLPAAAQTLFEDAMLEEEPVEQEYPYLSYGYDEESHSVFYGVVEESDGDDPDLDCAIPEGAVVEIDDDGLVSYTVEGEEPVDLPEDCHTVDIEGPNGQVNHGQFVSNMVHALKAEYYAADDAKEMYGPFGQWVKQFAHDKEIGKDDLKVKADPDGDDDLEPLELEAADADDDDEPGKGKDKNKDKGNGKGKKNG
ncbi:MAG: hypothetical protein ACN4GK_04520 [Acidimicrobiia bacterium]